MRNLKPYTDNSREFIDDLISKCKSSEKKSSCQDIANRYRECIDEYDNAFENDNLERLLDSHPQLCAEEKERFKSLYSYKGCEITKLRHKLLTDEQGFENEFCPICEVNLVQTMDHFIPQEQYPLYVVHPKNLIPCCQTCNQSKSAKTLDNEGKRQYWNAYLDAVPVERFLYCSISEKNGIPHATFDLQRGDINIRIFNLIENTMREQHVLKTYEAGSGREIKRLIIEAVSYVRKDACAHTLNDCIERISDLKQSCSEINNWKDVLDIALLGSPVFVRCLREELERCDVPFKD